MNHEELTKYNYTRLVWDVFIHRYFSNFYRAIFGVEFSGYGLHSVQSFASFTELSNNYNKLYAAFIQDSWDRGSFPTKGSRSKGRADLIVDNKGEMLISAWARNINIISVSKKIKIETEAFLGFGSYGLNSTMLEYRVGGLNRNRIQWYSQMPGLLYLEMGAANTWQLSIAPRWEFYKNNFITYKFAVSAVDEDFIQLFVDVRRIYAGMSLEYGYNSMFGPIKISSDYSFTSNYFGLFMSFGYWF